MNNKVVRHNIKFFTKNVADFQKDYFDAAEEYVVRNYFKDKKTLVLGCGAGRTLIPIHDRGFKVTGIDITPKMVQAAKKKVRRLDIKVEKMDACHLKFADNSFDNVFFPFHGIDCIYPDIFKAIMEAKRVIRADGVFVFNSHNRFNLKALPRFFEGSYTNYKGLITYRSVLSDFWKLKKLFLKVEKIPASSILVKWEEATWKEKVFKLLPFFDASNYFICKGK